MSNQFAMQSSRENILVKLLALTVLMVGCQRTTQTSAPKPAPKEQVTVGTVRTQLLEKTIHLPATIESDETAMLMARVEAYVDKVLVDIGDEVEAGQVLVLLHAPELEQRVEQHRAAIDMIRASGQMTLAELKTAQSQNAATLAQQSLKISVRDRLANLVHTGAIASQRLEEAEAALGTTNAHLEKDKNAIELIHAKLRKGKAKLEVEKAMLAQAEALGEYLKIKAPFAGVVAERNVAPGNLVRPSSQGSGMKPLLTIAKIDKLRAVVHATTDVAGQLRIGQAVQFVADDVPDHVFVGTLSRMAGTYSQRTRMMQAEVDLDNASDPATGQRPLRAGSYGSLSIVLQSAMLPVVPESALRKRGDRTSVVVVHDGACLVTPVTVAFASGEMVAIAEGIADGEQVVANPDDVKEEQKLKDTEIKTVSW